jgi:hypothetical protein
MKSTLLTLSTLVLCSALSACASIDRSLKTVSTQAVGGNAVGSPTLVSGESCRKDVLLVIAFEKGGALNEAIDDALSKAPGANVLTDVKVTKKRLFTVLYNYRCLKVEGKAISMR